MKHLKLCTALKYLQALSRYVIDEGLHRAEHTGGCVGATWKMVLKQCGARYPQVSLAVYTV